MFLCNHWKNDEQFNPSERCAVLKSHRARVECPDHSSFRQLRWGNQSPCPSSLNLPLWSLNSTRILVVTMYGRGLRVPCIFATCPSSFLLSGKPPGLSIVSFTSLTVSLLSGLLSFYLGLLGVSRKFSSPQDPQ